ncbi:TadE/TadG family type IV pilus assembly protein [Sphingosinicella soli]|uniref:Flp pilus assembly pilin Flp n=1 Tax=Sphingosinicella soli TaxID=333708 RepID=A0A7W7B029_9SPHN|nr:TadE/TadG family type IV pilus assembly protein [Sphingosinicella soli]MBB4631379.1 Flp pilus assembly pilin Flp [Sphingosinicella soli]
MKHLPNPLRRLRRDERGSYIIEFALLSLPMMTLLMGGIELGYLAYAKSNVEGSLREVSRLAATGGSTAEELDAILNSKIGQIKGASAEIERKSYTAFGAVGQPEPPTTLIPDGESPGPGDCFLDINGNGNWDADMGSDGLGNAEDILYYGVTVTYPMIFKLTSSIINGGKDNMTIQANAVIKNEPFSNIEIPPPEEVCIPS